MDSTVTTKGQITLPKAIRDHFGLKAGDRVKFFVDSAGHLAMLPVTPVPDLTGLFKYDGPPISDEEMEEAIAAGATARYEGRDE